MSMPRFSGRGKTQTRIDEVYLAQTGKHLIGNFNLGSLNISASDGFVRRADIDAATEDAASPPTG